MVVSTKQYRKTVSENNGNRFLMWNFAFRPEKTTFFEEILRKE
jgi:hypothetical protein